MNAQRPLPQSLGIGARAARLGKLRGQKQRVLVETVEVERTLHRLRGGSLVARLLERAGKGHVRRGICGTRGGIGAKPGKRVERLGRARSRVA